jgi:trans-aconitate 2-methyltransferase
LSQAAGPRLVRPSWDPCQYERFGGERLRPALDLIGRLDLDRPRRIVDLGCGTGEITALLKGRWPEAEVTGIDSAPAMLAKAVARDAGVAWVEADIAAWTPPEHSFDLVFSNAALHWLDGHERLMARLMRAVAGGGALAVQMPRNFAAPSHRLMREVAAAGAWRDRLLPLLRPEPVLPPQRYYDVLSPLASEIEIWESEYLHVLEGDAPVVEWVKGSALRPLLDALPEPALRQAFLALYGERIAAAYPRRSDGRTLFAFRRLFLIARP